MPVHPQIQARHDDMTAWRRDFHAHPEIGFEEVRTSAVVAEKLASRDIEVKYLRIVAEGNQKLLVEFLDGLYALSDKDKVIPKVLTSAAIRLTATMAWHAINTGEPP